MEKINKKLELIKIRNEILLKSSNEKDQQIADLNNIIIELKQKFPKNEQLSDLKKIQNNDDNISQNIKKYESQLNKIKNDLNESEIKNSKLILENNMLNEKIQRIEKEKNEEIKNMEYLHKKEIENYDKIKLELNEKINLLLKKEEKNKNNTNKNEEEKFINELNQKDDKLKELNEEHIRLKKYIQELNYKNEELKLACQIKEKTIEKLELEIEKIDHNLEESDEEKKTIKNKNINNLNILIKENEELKLGLKDMTEGINQANELYNEKLNCFKKEILIKNNKLNEYKNIILILKKKIFTLNEELFLIKNENINSNSYFNANFINNSIINSNSTPKYNEKKINNYNLMLNKNYSNINKRLITNNCGNTRNKIIKFGYNSDKNRVLNKEYSKFSSMTDLNIHKNNIINLNKRYQKINNTLDFINKNKEEDKNHLIFIKQYKKILDKFQDFQ